jgi:SnoaL-like domain
MSDARVPVEEFRRGWEALDANAVLGTFARDSSVLVWGTDADEEWRGFEALAQPFHAQVKAFSETAYAWEKEPATWSGGDLACVAGVLRVSLKSGAEQVSIPMRSTFVLARRAEGWRIVHAHFSVGQAQQVATYG